MKPDYTGDLKEIIMLWEVTPTGGDRPIGRMSRHRAADMQYQEEHLAKRQGREPKLYRITLK